ncbi:uncharacterized protein LOC142552208 isoform X1 [Primulina tabacum]|uniref:uncharacterized protein LOC142552208 isoform X1 n=1 Tax=Primulina tabacum TaxID=48773 RepID=UPI003F59AC7D
MFKSARWRSDKNKVKAVFKLQFHAAQLTKVVGDELMVSLIPGDTGKPTAKSDKAVVRDGRCLWENPVYETVKFNREPKSGKIHERKYYFAVGTGQPKAGLIGEASIDFSSYAEANKVTLVSLPLEKSHLEAILHVSIQRIQESIEQRDLEESENVIMNSKDHSLRAQFVNNDIDGTKKEDSFEDVHFNLDNNQSSETKRNRKASSESDVTLSSSESSWGIDMPWEPQIKNHSIHCGNGESVSSRSQGAKSDGMKGIYEVHYRSQWDWIGNSALEASTDDYSGTPRETSVRQHSESPLDVIENLKTEVAALSRQAEMSELELQTLRRQIMKESKRGQDLSREIVFLTESNSALEEECERLEAFQRKSHLNFKGEDSRTLVKELRQELNHAKELNVNLRIQLQKTQESNAELILAVQDLDEMLEKKNQEISSLSNRSLALINTKKKSCELDSVVEMDDEEQKALEELVNDHSGSKEAYLLEQQMVDLRGEIEIFRRDKDELELQMEQIALDYEILKQENHEMSYRLEQSQIQEQLKIQYECSSSYTTARELESQIEKLENELKIRSKEFTDSLVTISELEARAKVLEEELEKQALGFEVDLEALMCSKVEQEQRAIRAEETLRKTRWQNAHSAERLQDECRRLSLQMASTFEANEKLAIKALAEANELRLEKIRLEEMLENASEEHKSIKDHYEARLHQLSSNMALMEQQKTHATETEKLLSEEILTMKEELEQMRKSTNEMELLMERGNNERAELEISVKLVKNEAEDLQKELNKMRCLLDKKEMIDANLQSELDTLQSHYKELTHILSNDKLKNEKLKEQVMQLQNDLKKRGDALKSMEKKTKDINNRGNNSAPLPCGNKDVANLKERIKLLEGQIVLKETALETLSNLFLEREKDLRNEIQELEERLEVLKQSSALLLENAVEKVVAPEENVAANSASNPESTKSDEKLSKKFNTSNDSAMSSMNGEDPNLSSAVLKDSTSITGDVYEKRNEMALLMEKNRLMEEELKEMQGRYSEISLKFAEVEGERQQLVMRLRNLKNAKKSP